MFSREGYDFSPAKVCDVLDEIKSHFEENNHESGVPGLPFNPDFDRYLRMDEFNQLKFFVVRFGKKIVGYACFFVDAGIQHKDQIVATQSLNFVSKEHRGIGYHFMKYCDAMLKELGVNCIWRQASVKFDIGKIYERMGYHLIEKTYLRRL